MRYLGSKTLLLDKIYEIVKDYSNDGIFCDPFGGIGTVGSYMKKKGYQVITGDILQFAHFFQVALIECNNMPRFNKVREKFGFDTVNDIEQYLNSVVSTTGWLVEEYAFKRKFFTVTNAIHIQGCIDSINIWRQENLLEKNEYEVLIASLIQSFDKVANTAGTYYAYLKKYYRKAMRPFYFSLIKPVEGNNNSISVLMDANQLVRQFDCKILYLDPPYNQRSYEKYYHLPETVSCGIKPLPKGKSGVNTNHVMKSLYNKKLMATDTFKDLINHTKANYIIFHYTDNGLIPCEEAKKILEAKGKVEEFFFDCKGYNVKTDIKQCQHHIFRMIS